MYEKIVKEDMPEGLIANSMRVCFGEEFTDDYFRYDFMLLSHEDSSPEGFVLCQELNKDFIWLAYGGVAPAKRGMKTIKSFKAMLGILEKEYKYIGAQVENTNYAMLKIYIANEFKIVGTRQNGLGKIFVEFLKDISKENSNG